MFVIDNENVKTKFKPKKIKDKIIEETNLDDDNANKITQSVVNSIKDNYEDVVSTTTIRSLINAQLIKRGLLDEELKSRKLGMSVSDFEELINYGCKDNANIGYSPEMISKYAYDSIAKEYALITMPKDCADAHINGYYHCLSGNNDLIVKIGNNISVKNIVDVIDDLEDNDIYVPSVNPTNNNISWNKIIDGACTGIKEVFELEFSKGYKIECTSNHKFLKFNSKDNRFSKDYDICIDDFKKLSNIRLGSLNLIPYNVNSKNYYESAFYGFFLGDGSINNNYIQFHLKKDDKIDYIISVLEKLDINYKKVNSGYTIMIYCDNFLNIKDKFTPLSLELNHMGLLEGLINSDGYVTTHGGLNNNYLEFDNTNKFIMDLYFISCLACNIRPSYKKYNNIYRAVAQNENVDELLNNITLRKGHLKKDSTKNQKVKDLSGLTPKRIKCLGEQLVYNITVEDNHNFMAGTQGFVLTQNCHDLEYYSTRPNCLSGNNNIIIKDEEGNISYTTIKEFVEEMFLSDKTYYVPSLNIKTNSMEWKRIENAYLSSPSEETYLVTFGKGYSIECTSDHKFIKSHNNKAQKQYDIKVSEFDNYKDLRLCNITDLNENNDLNDYNESALFGFFLGDGYISNKGNLKFSFSKKDKAEYLYHLLEQLNINFTYIEKESDTGYLYSFYIKDKIYPQLSKSELIKKYTSKYNLTGILEGLINSDGHIRLDINNVLRLNFTNTNKSIFDLYQLCLISNGIRGSINITEFNNPNHNDAYNSSSFGEKLLSLLSSMNICNRFVPIIEKANPNMKKYNEISELNVKSIEYTGTQPVYNLTIADNHNYLAGINGFILTQNCMNYDLRFFARNGLKIDGVGLMGSVAKPSKSLEVLINHLSQGLMAGATVFSGGQGIANFNTLLAPYCKGRSYKDIKQAIQSFIFNANMGLTCRGGQVLFSSIGVDLSIPNELKNQPAITCGGVVDGVYGDYQDEADLVFRAICEVLNEKDGNNAYHRFPNCNSFDTPLILRKNGVVTVKNIGEFVDDCINKEYNNYFDSKISTCTDDYEVLSVNKDTHNLEWKKITCVIRNPNQDIYEVKTTRGFSLKVTANHPFITYAGSGFGSFDGRKLSSFKHSTRLCTFNDNLIDYIENDIGTFIGFFLGDGSKDTNIENRLLFNLHKEDKIDYLDSLLQKIGFEFIRRDYDNRTEFTLLANKQPNNELKQVVIDCYNMKNNKILSKYNNSKYYLGLFAGLINSDGYIHASKDIDKPSNIVKFSNTNKELINLYTNIAHVLGLTLSKSLKQKPVKSTHEKCYDIRFGGNTMQELLNHITLRDGHKSRLIDVDYIPRNHFSSISIKSIEKVDYEGYTYDLEVEDNHNYFAGEIPVLNHNCLFNIREGDLDEYSGTCKMLHELGANNPTIYYVNCTDMERTVMGALTSDTPVMTNKGFKYPYELKIGDTVMTYSSDGSKCWNKIYNVIEKTAPSKVFKITCDNGYSFKVTDNHKLPTLDGIVKSENLKVGMELYDYVDELFNPTDDYEAEFIGVFLADGFIKHKPRHQYDDEYIEFHVCKEWKLKEIIKLCEKCNYNYKFIQRKDKSFSIKVYEKELRDKLVKLYDDNLGVKRFPSEYWNDKNKLANIIKGLMFDGRKHSNTSYIWSCSDKELVYDVCYTLSYLGLYSSIYVDIRKGKTGNWRTNYRITFGKDKKPKHTRGRKTTTIKSIELVDNTEPVYDLSIENNPNYVCGLGGIHSENCRTATPMNYAFDYEKDCLNTGNFMYNTINLPLIALDSNGDESKFYEMLDEICELIYKSLLHRRKQIESIIYDKHMSDFLLQKDKDTGEPLWDINRTTITIGFCGLNECLIALYGDGLPSNTDKGKSIIEFINKKKDEFKNRDGLRWSVIGSPAESTAHRFATIIKDKYPNAKVQGVKGSYYLTNSSHIPVNSDDVNLFTHIENASNFHKLTGGGNILHLWLGEVWSDAESVWKLNKKIIEKGATFWAYSKVFSYCNTCEFTINDKVDICPVCHSDDITTYDRITGYYLPTTGFNNGKCQEFNDRYRFDLGDD